MGTKYFIVGGAGFIGSHFCRHLISQSSTGAVTVYDNFSSGRHWHIEDLHSDSRFNVVRGDVKDLELLTSSMRHHDVVIHLASNPDIAAAAANPPIDFWEGTYLTQNVVEAMRVTATKTILYASGSGIYGDLGNYEIPEDHGPLIPVSTYGASKLAGEALISSYCHMFGLTGRCFRFGNVVGPSQTHGVGYDFICRLTADPSQLRILGNGQQTKSYIHVDDIINAVLHSYSCETKRFQVYNVATGDYITVNRIAELAAEALNLDFTTIQLNYTGGDRGWLGDVPIVRLDTKRIQDLGWKCRRNCEEAISASVRAIATQVKNGLIPIPHS